MTTWHAGDFGRFNIENRQFPRFEVIRADKQKGLIYVWYSGQSEPTPIPIATFQRDCVKWWDIAIIHTPVPTWLVPGCHLTLDSPQRGINVIITQIKQQWRNTTQGVDVKGRTLQYRRRRGDYISCLTEDPTTLLLVPLQLVIDFGRPIQTRWDVLRNLDIIDLEEELL